MTVTTPKSGTLMSAADVHDRHQQVRAILNALGVTQMRPESIGPQHVEGLVVAGDSVEQPSSAAWTVTTHAAVAPETEAQIIATWQQNAGLLLNNGGAGYTIPKPFILIECMSYRIDRIDEAGGARPGTANDGVFVNLYKRSNGGTGEVSRLMSRYHRLDPLNNAGGPAYVGGDAIGHSPTIWRVTEYTGAGNYVLDHLQMRAICVPRLAAVGPDVIVRNGRIWFLALRIPG